MAHRISTMLAALVAAVVQAAPDGYPRPACTISVPVEGKPIAAPVQEGDLHLGCLRVAIGSWNNSKNRLKSRPFVATLDLGRVRPVRRVRLDCNPPNKWYSLAHARLEASATGETWEPLGEKKGPGPTREVGTVPFELAVDVGKRFRFVRATVTPQSFYHLTIRSLDVYLDPTPEVQSGMDVLTRDVAFYEPDGPIDERWAKEGFWAERWRNFDPSVPRVGGPGAYVKAYFHNRTDKPLAARGLKLNRVSVDKHLHDTKDPVKGTRRGTKTWASLWIEPDEESKGFQALVKAGEPVWYKTEPAPLPPGGIAEVTLRLRTQPAGPIELALATDAGELTATTQPVRPAIDVLYVGFANVLREVLLYTRGWGNRPDPIARVYLDGVDQVGRVQAYQAKWVPAGNGEYGLAAFRIRLDKPLEQGSFHTIGLVTAAGKTFRTQVRAWVNPFVIGMMGSAWRETPARYYSILKRHNFNTVLWDHQGEPLHRKHQLRALPRPQQFDSTSDALVAYYNLDEPDVKDYYAKEIKEYWRRPGATARYCLAKRRKMQETAPRVPGMVLVDSTFKPINYATYAQLSDFPACDPYAPRNKPAFGLHYVSAIARATAAHAEPKPSFTLLYCSGNPKKGRFLRYPTPDEEWLMASYALAAGSKGIGYYWWRGKYGATNNPELLRGLSDLNGRLQQIGALVARSVPTGWAKASADKAVVQALWTAGDGLAVVVTNEDYTTDTSAEGTTTLRPQSNVQLTCRLPEGAREWRLFKVTPLAWEPMPEGSFTIVESSRVPHMTWSIPELAVAEWYVIAPGPY